ncbi:deoxyribose-phosphate aldolase [Christiangramia sp. SM2212]|uniref:Deoxyribose-phosphate aldolase n=1 Tax=Christiangramia sediminicola TaxID=3073267 RepID=A0ABU1EU33_9FLAO|nr:deoxyribose-phosphate aldolase [Christiangramia sp. SM2212]MDR5591915.1 deoxyribose-phosphate aldolase [Christiangramia sp. SM2212]
MQLNKYIDHTYLKPTAISEDIKKLCDEALEYSFYAVCVNSSYVKLAKDHLEDSEVKIAATIGFPLGASSSASKVCEAENCINDGADEIDMVINIGFLEDGKFDEVQKEILEIKKAIGDKILKVIIETGYLSETEIEKASELAMKAKADFVKTSTGFGERGASLEDIRIMKKVVGDKLKIKASGGIRDRKTAEEYIALGVDRIGTSSGIEIVS